MFFRNLSCYRFTSEIDLDALAAKLQNAALRPVGPLELSTIGFVPPLGDGPLAHWVGDAMLVSAAQQERLLPSDVITRALNDRLKQIHADEGRKVGSKERKRIKEELFTLMLPQAFVRQRKTNLYFTRDGWLVIDHGSRKVVEAIISIVREAAGSFPCVPMAPEESPRALMTDWVIKGSLPEGLVLGDQIELRDPCEAGAVVRCSNQDLQSDETGEHLRSGKQVFRLALVFNNRISFVLDEALCVHKVRFLDAVQDELGEKDRDSIAAEIDATFALMSGELKLLLAWMETTFGISPAPKLKLDGGDAAPEMRESAPAPRKGKRGFADAVRDAVVKAVEGTGATVLHNVALSDLKPSSDTHAPGDASDELYDKAVAHVNATNSAGISALQRALKIGYNRAARLVETMEQLGVVSAAKYDGTREVLAPAAPIVNQKAEKFLKEATAAMKKAGLNVSADFRVGNSLTERLNKTDRAKLTQEQLQWLEHGERGSSSDTMFARLGGISTAGCDLCHPLDPADLRRCRMLLEVVPEFGARISEMADVSDVWAALVNVWGTLCATMDDECPKWRDGIGTCAATMEFMQEIGC